MRAAISEVRQWLAELPVQSRWVLLLAPVLLTLSFKLGAASPGLTPGWTQSPVGPRSAAVNLALLYLLPCGLVRLAFRSRLHDYGHRVRPLLHLGKLLFAVLVVLAPVVYATAAYATSVRAFYPLHRADDPTSMAFGLHALWYACMILAQEFFYRGFVIEGLRARLGPIAIAYSAGLYCIAHWHKPLIEALASLVTGLFLGWVAYRHRTIFFGVVVHLVAALALDLLLLFGVGP